MNHSLEFEAKHQKILNKADFETRLEMEIVMAKSEVTAGRPFDTGGLLTLLFVQPLDENVDKQSLDKIGQTILQTTMENNIVGHVDPKQYGVILPGLLLADSLFLAKQILDIAPVPVAMGLGIFRSTYQQTDSPYELYDASVRALSLALKEAKIEGKSKIVTLLREGQDLSEDNFPEDLQPVVTLIHI